MATRTASGIAVALIVGRVSEMIKRILYWLLIVIVTTAVSLSYNLTAVLIIIAAAILILVFIGKAKEASA